MPEKNKSSLIGIFCFVFLKIHFETWIIELATSKQYPGKLVDTGYKKHSAVLRIKWANGFKDIYACWW